MRRTVTAVFVFLLTVSAFAAETKRYFVGTSAPMSDETQIRRLYREIDAEVQPRQLLAFRSVNAFAADLTEDEVRALKRSSKVTYIEPVLEMRAFTAPIRNYGGAQTVPVGVDTVKARETWFAGRGAGTNVVVVDTGVDYNHPDLKAIWKGGEDYINNDGDPMDDAGHGTHVAGTIAAADDAQGVVGVAPGIRLWAVKVLNSEGTGNNDKLLRALDWVIAKKQELGGNWVVNLSLGHAGSSITERNTINRALDAGILIAAASGNESGTPEGGIKPVAYPAAYDRVLTVGAVGTDNKTIALFSNQGPEMDLVAPGVDVLSTVPVGFGSKSYIGEASELYFSLPLAGSPRGTVTGEYVYCGLGGPDDFPASVRGKVALIQRGEHKFAWKSRRAKEAGATAVVIFDSANPTSPGLNWTMRPNPQTPDPDDVWMANYEYLLTVNMVHADGLALSKKTGASLTAVFDKDDYDIYQGTSMATPHVAGAAALVWSLAPNATPEQIRSTLTSTAKDLGNAGQDSVFGYGLLDVLAAAKQIAPNWFIPIETNPKPTTGRKPGRRG